MPEILDNQIIKGTIIYPDAMGTQTGTAEQIISAEDEYVLRLKENHKHLFFRYPGCFYREIHASCL